MKLVRQLAILGSLGIMTLVMGSAVSLATAPTGFGATATYRATVEPYHFQSNDFKVDQKNSQDVVVRVLTIAPAGDSGWHFHPGPVYVLVTQGTVTNYNADDPTCTGTTISAGQAFVEPPGNVHIVRNEGTVTAVLVATFLDVPVGGAFRIDAPKPGNCSF